MSAPIADGVMAVTYKLVQQAMTGQWQDVPKTVEERRLMLDQLAANARPQDQQWLSALRQAMAESDAVVAGCLSGLRRNSTVAPGQPANVAPSGGGNESAACDFGKNVGARPLFP